MSIDRLPRFAERLLGLDPVPPPPHVFALRPGELRYGGFAHGERGLAWTASRDFPLDAELFPAGPLGSPVTDANLFTTEVRAAVAALGPGVEQASLVVPDEWLRLTFVEADALPRKPRQRDEVLRWKLKRLVPFRVEDLRLAATEVRRIEGQAEPLRLLVGFGIEQLLAQLEDAFAAAGVAVGRIVNTSLALVAAVSHTVAKEDTAALVAVYPEAYTLTLFQEGEPLLYRYKARSGPESNELRSFRRDLRMTGSYIEESFPGMPVRRFFLIAPGDEATAWAEALHEELSTPPELLSHEHLPVKERRHDVPLRDAAALAGAATMEVR